MNADPADHGSIAAALPADELPLWHAVGRVIDAAPTLADLRAHRLHLLAARRWRTRGSPVPEELAAAELAAARVTLAAPLVLERIRAACEGPLVLMKGYELALRYPDPATRPFDDIDLLAENPEAVSRALRAAGFQPLGEDDAYYLGRHHLRPLFLPDLPIVVEVHRRPEWVSFAPTPAASVLIEAAVPSLTGIGGLLALAPAHHALAVAAHSWSDLPLRRILDLVDAAAVAADAAPGEVEHWARAFGIEPLWSFIRRVQDALFAGAPPPASLRLWGGAFLRVQDPSVAEQHKRRLLAAFAVLPAHRALAQVVAGLVRTAMPEEGEPWSTKRRRALLALRHRSTPRSAHDRAVAEQIRQKTP